jgi:pimeloyl-ACP methyl ester carboxylesterase
MARVNDHEPKVLAIRANGLDHHVLEWAPPAWGATALLLHGLMDAAANWELVAPHLVQAGFRVLAPDLRGFGEGARAPPGSYYHFVDYVADLAELIQTAALGVPLLLVGHSMGGNIATLFTGAFPAQVQKLALLEGGLGPLDTDFHVLPDRMQRWIEQVRGIRATQSKVVGTMADAYRRLAANHPDVDPDTLRTRLPRLVRDLGDGRVAWRADPLHRTLSPTTMFVGGYRAFADRITCPVLYVDGGPGGLHLPDEDERLTAFARLERFGIDGAGHMMHWTRPKDVADKLVAFWGAA